MKELVINFRILCICACVLISINSTGLAEEIRDLIVVRPGGFYPPYEMMIDNHLTGFHIDLLNSVGKQLNVKINFKSVPWQRALHMVKSGSADAITFISKTPEREEFVYFDEGNVISYTVDGFFILKERSEEISYSGDLRQLSSYKIGMLAGYTYGSDFDDAAFLFKDYGAKVEAQLIEKLLAGRFDIAIGNVARVKFIAMQMKVNYRLFYLHPSLSRAPNYIGFSKINSLGKFSKRFGKTLELFKKTSSYDTLVNQYEVEN